ncbi:MAG: hypothetical protein J1E99_04115 [Muribaculaceae bacterium]|nr:hypothetical protein [Muribaculaceae bacterium]
MKKKFLNGLFAVLVASASAVMFNSCKDTDEDMYVQLESEIKKGQTELASQITNLASQVNDLSGRLTAAEGNIASLQSQINDINDDITDIKSQLDALSYLDDEDVKDAIEWLVESKEGLQELLDEDAALHDWLEENDYETLIDALEDILAKIEDLQKQVDNLTNRFNNLITSLNINAVANPVFGYINTPFGVNTNILMAYYGEVNVETIFPDFEGTGTPEYNGNWALEGVKDALKAAGVEELDYITIPAGIVGAEDGVLSLGSIYLTINPVNVDLTGKTFALETTDGAGDYLTVEVAKSSDRLAFGQGGISRAGDNGNGFYAGKVTISTDNLDEIVVDNTGLKSALEAAVKNPTKSDLVSLIKKIYSAYNGVLPAYAVTASWEDDTIAIPHTINAVYSNYEIAATAREPFSFETGFGVSIDKKIPNLPTADELRIDVEKLKNKINESLADFDIQITGDFNVDLRDLTAPTVTVGGQEYELNNWGRFIDELSAKLNNQFNEQVAQIITEQVVAAIKEKLREASGSLINGIDKVASKLDPYMTYLDRINSLIDKANDFLSNPNQYLQVMMAYEGVDGAIHRLSQVKDFPTPVEAASNAKEGIVLYPTTYTAELVAPAYKKYVAVVGVTGGTDAENKAELKAANSGNLNTVLPGTTVGIGFSPKAGFTYEILYTAIDFHGYTSTATYYVAAE